MNLSVSKIFWRNLLIFPFLSILLYFNNHFFAKTEIPIIHILVIATLLTFYFTLIFIVVWYVCYGTWKEKLMAVFGLILLYKTNYPILYYFIYEWLPDNGMILYRKDVVYNKLQFIRRINSTFFMLCTMSVLLAYFIRYRFVRRLEALRRSEVTQLEKQLLRNQMLLRSKHLQPHFIEGIIATVLGRSLLVSKSEKYANTLLNLVDILHYMIQADACNPKVIWDEEWKKMKHLIALIREYDSYKNISMVGSIYPQNLLIPQGLLLFPIENALKYALWQGNQGLQIKCEENMDHYIVTYENKIDRINNGRLPSSKTGISLYRDLLDAGAWDIKLQQRQDLDNFIIQLQFRK